MIRDISFLHPYFFYLLLVIPLLMLWYKLNKRGSKPDIKISSFRNLESIKPSFKVRLRHLLFNLRLLGIALLIVALARPQSKTNWQNIKTEGIDIVIAMDVSPSMLSKDLKPNRLEASKEVAIDFIDGRPNDRIGLVIFGGESFTQCPLTTDHAVLKNLFQAIQPGALSNGTAIGMGLATAVNRIKDSKAKSKVIILLTDGVNNTGSVSPELAAEIAKPFNIRVYTIGVGTTGMAYSPVNIRPDGEYIFDYVKVDIDEAVLKKISSITNGKYFRAADNYKLKKVYAEIDKLEKTIIEEKKGSKKTELFLFFATTAGILLLLEFLLRYSYFRSAT